MQCKLPPLCIRVRCLGHSFLENIPGFWRYRSGGGIYGSDFLCRVQPADKARRAENLCSFVTFCQWVLQSIMTGSPKGYPGFSWRSLWRRRRGSGSPKSKEHGGPPTSPEPACLHIVFAGQGGGQTPAVPRRRPRPWQLGAVLDSLSFFLFPHFQPICWEGKRTAMLFNGATAGIMQLDNPSP